MFCRIVSICNRERPTTGIGKVGIESAKAVEAPLDPANPGGDKVKLLALGDKQISSFQANPKWRGENVAGQMSEVSSEHTQSHCYHTIGNVKNFFEGSGVGTELFKNVAHPSQGNVLVIKTNAPLVSDHPVGAPVTQNLGTGGSPVAGELLVAAQAGESKCAPPPSPPLPSTFAEASRLPYAALCTGSRCSSTRGSDRTASRASSRRLIP